MDPQVQGKETDAALLGIAKQFGGKLLGVVLLEVLLKLLVAHPFEVMSVRSRVSVPERQGSLWRGFVLRVLTGLLV